MMRIALIAALVVGGASTLQAAGFELASGRSAAAIFVPATEPECVRLAAEDLAGDVGKIVGRKPQVVTELEACGADAVVIASAEHSAELLKRFDAEATHGLAGKWEAYRVRSLAANVGPVRNVILMAGSDQRGAMFAAYAFAERYLGVDPMSFWADRPPQRRERLAWDKVDLSAGEPTFRYRGWFINDEDLLTEWYDGGGRRDIDYPYYHQITSPLASRHVFEAMLRLQYNLVIPASFVDICNPAEARLVEDASRRGLLVSMHHVEPMGVSGFTFLNYWKAKGRDVPFSYFRYPKEYEEVWRHYAARWARIPGVVWQLGLRGIADRPLWASDPAAPKTDEGRGKLISDAMALQWKIVRSVDPRPDPPATTTLWMEGADLHKKGMLRFPPGVAVIFSDNSPGWMLQPDFYEVAREPGRPYGVYYHHALWGSGPHLAQGVSPQKTYSIFGQALQRGSTHYAMLNVSNVREFVLGLDATARLLRDYPDYDPDRFLTQWCRERFGEAAGEVEQSYRKYFASFTSVPYRGDRAMLDGEIVHAGTRLLAKILKPLDSGKRFVLADRAEIGERAVQVARQRNAVAEAGARNGVILARLDGPGRGLFETNFVAQQGIQLGLLEWLQGVLGAARAVDAGATAAAAEQLRAAEAGMARVRRAQELTSRGVWTHWYRGDRKMNLARCEELTAKLADVLKGASTR